jgi:hypothetical protein
VAPTIQENKMKKMNVEEIKSAVARNQDNRSEFPYLPLHDLVLIYQIKPEMQGSLHLPEHLQEKADGVVFVVCATGPHVDELIQPGLEVTVGSGGNAERHIDMGDGFYMVSENCIVCVTNERFVDSDEDQSSGLITDRRELHRV